MCHGIDIDIVGPSMNKATKDYNLKKLEKLVNYSKSHNQAKLSKEELKALKKFLNL